MCAGALKEGRSLTDQPLILPPTFRDDVAKAMKAWRGDASQDSPLDYLFLVQIALVEGSQSLRHATNQVLLRAIETMAESYDREVEVLRLRFLNGELIYTLANRFNISEPTVYRLQAQALDHLADTLARMEKDAHEARFRQLETRLEPPSAASLVGVDRHIDRLVDELWRSNGPALVLIEGTGGIGKTTLADAVLRRLIHERPAGEIGWVSARYQRIDLAGALWSTERPALTPEALLDALARQVLPGAPPFSSSDKALAALRAHLAKRPAVIVVDNLETVADVSGLLPALRQLANPTRFLLTSRRSLYAEADLYHYRLPELAEPDALRLVRQEAVRRNLPDLASASDAELHPIVATVGGNPLALRLVVGQTHVHPLRAVLEDLTAARGPTVENLYAYLYRRAWDSLDELSRRALLAMPLATGRGADLAYLAEISELNAGDLRAALTRLVDLNLVDSRGDLNERRYAIHALTRSFLMEQVVRWKG